MKRIVEDGPLPGWAGGSFHLRQDTSAFGTSNGSDRSVGGVIGWDVRDGLFWIHSFRCGPTDSERRDVRSAAALVQAVRAKARSLGHSKVFWQVVPETGFAMLKTLAKGRAKIDYIQMYMDV